MAKTRYRQADQECIVTPWVADGLEVVFDVPQGAVTPGQFVVFYKGDECLGGATIEQFWGDRHNHLYPPISLDY